MTIKAPIKNYRLRKLSKKIKKLFFSEALQVYLLARKWNKKDLSPINSENNEIASHEDSLFSQNGEDGIIRYIFSQIGFESRYFVEFGFGAHQCNSLRLILHENFKGLMMDGSEEQCRIFNLACKSKGISDVHAANAFINRDNLEHLIRSNNIPAQIDFLSIDVDGNDYWLWKSIEYINPKVCCFETHNVIPSDLSLTIPYDPSFNCWTSENPDFRSVSLAAMVNLSKKKGYTLVGAHRHGFNVFFVRNDLLGDFLAECPVEIVHDNFYTQYSQSVRWERVKHSPWEKIL